ncbi:MAG: hypothetical protein WC378_04450 [Opitutaceae bacterium]|jgi:hypothetical protein
MSLANTLSVLLNFKTDLSGLEKFTTAFNERLKTVEAFNSKIKNGAQTVNNALQAAAGYLAIGALREYTAEAIDARKAEAKLGEALKQTGQFSAEYQAELEKQATAMQGLTGIEDELISGVQRQLIFGKAQRKDIAELTSLTLDFAAAKEIDAVSASKAVSRALLGEGDELKRYGVELGSSLDKVTALKEGMAKFKGQAAESFASLPEGMREFALASKEAKKSAGEAVITISNPFLSGLADGISKVAGRLENIRKEGSLITDIFTGASQSVGSFVGGNLDKIVMFVGALLALKAGAYIASQSLAVLASGFLALTGTHLPEMIARMSALIGRFGLFRVIVAGGWPGALAAGIVAIGGALAVLGIGSVVIDSIKEAQLSRLEREDKILAAIYEQNHALNEQASKARSVADINARIAADEKMLAAEKEKIDRLLERKDSAKKNTAARTFALASPEGGGFSAPTEQWTEADERELNGRRDAYGKAEARIATQKNPEWQERTISGNLAADAKAEQDKKNNALVDKLPDLRKKNDEDTLAALTPEKRIATLGGRKSVLETELAGVGPDGKDDAGRVNEARRLDLKNRIFEITTQITEAQKQQDEAEKAGQEKIKQAGELQNKQALFEIETAISEAQADGNQDLVDQLTRQRDEMQMLNELGNGAYASVQDRLNVTQELALVERTREEQEQQYSIRLGEIARQRAEIESNRYITEEEQKRRLLPLLEEENRLIAARIALLEREFKGPVTEERKGQITTQLDQLRGQQATNSKDRADNSPQTMGQGVAQGVGGKGGFLDSLGTSAQMAANAVTGTLNTALQSTGDLLYNLASHSMHFSQAWRSATLAVGQQFLRMVTDMVAKLIWRSTIERMLIWLGVSTHVAGETTKTTSTLAGSAIRIGTTIKEALADVYHGAVAAFKALCSIPYVGPVLGAIAMAAALAGGIALVSKISKADGGLITGPGGPRDDKIPVNLSNGEFIIPAVRVSQFGQGFFESIRQGVMPNLPSQVAGSMARPYTAQSSGTALAPASGGSEASQSSGVSVYTAVFFDMAAATAWLGTKQGQKRLMRVVGQGRAEAGMET